MTLTQITEKGIKDGEIINADINASAAIAGTKISPNFGAQNVTCQDLTLADQQPRLIFTDNAGTPNNPDYLFQVDGGTFLLHDSTNVADRFSVAANGHITSHSNHNFNAGIDVTGTITSTGIATFNNTINLNHASAGSNIIYFNEDLQFSRNGTGTRIKIASDGKVGIGTSNPGTLLHLSGGGNTALSINTGNDNGDNSTINFGDSADGNPGFINYDHGTNALQFSVTGETMSLDSQGILGIGVTPQTGQYSGYNHLQIGESAVFSSNDTQGDTNVTNIAQNAYLNANASAWKYLHTDEATLYQTHSGNHHFYIAPQGNQDNTITFTERFAVRNDGVTFNGDTAAANALDDYEEGQWTPAYHSGVTSQGSYSNTLGHYTKIGNVVYFTGRIQMSGSDANFHHVIINGLPFTSDSSKKEGGASIGYGQALNQNNTAGKPTAHIPQNSSSISFYEPSGNVLYANNSTFVNLDETLHFRGFYYTA